MSDDALNVSTNTVNPASGAAEPRPARPPRIVVTGANTGIGYFVSEQLAATGATVILACRNDERAATAMASILRRLPDAALECVTLDLADLESVENAVAQILAGGGVDVVIANAGVLGSRERQTTRDGFELQFGVNHLGHFALVSRLLAALNAAPAGRIVFLGSIAHRFSRLDLNDPMMVARYRSGLAYSRSKLAVMTFGFELDRRLRAAGSSVRSIVAHPGFSWDYLSDSRPSIFTKRWLPALAIGVLRTFSQGKDQGARPISHAAVATDVDGGEYWGPDGWFQLTGAPAIVHAKPRAHDRKTATRLWNLSARLTRVQPPLD